MIDQGIPPPADDGLLTRPAGVWALDKLEIVREYLPRFGNACKNKAPVFHFVDAFSGPGVNLVKSTNERVWGSPILALHSEPPFSSCLLMDKGRREVRSLQERTHQFGDRAVVREGDANQNLVPLMKERLDPWHPCLCLLDPEGSELDFQTVAAVADFKRSTRFKAEQLILLATDTGFMRGLFLKKPPPEWSPKMMDRIFGTDNWHSIYERRLNDQLTADDARQEYVNLYKYGLHRELGYKTTLARQIRSKGFAGRLYYYLIFATDNDAGTKIMDSIFKKVVGSRPGVVEPKPKQGPGEGQTSFFPLH